MEQLEFFKIPNPCISVCEANQRGYCKGCFRSREERVQWLQYTSAQKQAVWRLCLQRRRKNESATLPSLPMMNEDMTEEPEFDFD